MSTRYWLPTVTLLLLALVPTVIHGYLGMRMADPRDLTRLEGALGDMRCTRTDRKDKWVRDTYDSTEWIELQCSERGDSAVLLFAARSYDAKRLYHHPELGVARGIDLGRETVERVPGREHVPLHVLRGAAGQDDAIVVYALLYGDDFVDDPYRLQLRSAVELRVSPRRPVTLFLAVDRRARGVALGQTAGARALFSAIARHTGSAVTH